MDKDLIIKLEDFMGMLTKEKMSLEIPDDDLNMAILYLDCCIDRLLRRTNK